MARQQLRAVLGTPAGTETRFHPSGIDSLQHAIARGRTRAALTDSDEKKKKESAVSITGCRVPFPRGGGTRFSSFCDTINYSNIQVQFKRMRIYTSSAHLGQVSLGVWLNFIQTVTKFLQLEKLQNFTKLFSLQFYSCIISISTCDERVSPTWTPIKNSSTWILGLFCTRRSSDNSSTRISTFPNSLTKSTALLSTNKTAANAFSSCSNWFEKPTDRAVPTWKHYNVGEWRWTPVFCYLVAAESVQSCTV